MARQTAGSTAASHSTRDNMVAMLGQIMPAPLAAPARRTEPPVSRISAPDNLGKASVVMMARAKSSRVAWPREAARAGTAARHLARSIRAPMTPVDAGKMEEGGISTAAPTISSVARQSSKPSWPVQALAWPELIRTARGPEKDGAASPTASRAARAT